MKFNAVATSLFGLEKIVEFELKKAAADSLKVDNGRVFFSGDAAVIATANITSRSAERILIILARFKATDFDQLFDEVKQIDWTEYIDKTDVFPVKGYSVDSQLSSVPAMQSVIKKAIVESLKPKYGSSLPEDGRVIKAVRFSMIKNECLIMLDSSGNGLHKRGYRKVSGEAPIKETLAAGIADLARVREDSQVVDPFCGSGTLLIEAALKAKNIPPGINRHFAAEDYHFIGRHVFEEAKQKATDNIRQNTDFFAKGSDIDPSAIELAKRAAARAGVASMLELVVADAREIKVNERELIITNPPYGERLMSPIESERLLKDFFNTIEGQKYKGLYVISSNPSFEHVVQKIAKKRRKMYNGMIQCNLYMYF